MKANRPNAYRCVNVVLTCLMLGLLSSLASAECFQKSAFWKFEEQTEPFVDSVNPGGPLDGTCIDSSSCPESVTDRFGSALRFYKHTSGSGGTGINVALSPQGDAPFDWSAQDSFSIAFWMKRDTTKELTRNEVIIGRDRLDTIPDVPDEIHWWIGVEFPQGTAYARFDVRPWCIWSGSNRYARGKNNDYLLGTKVINDNAWHHIVFVRNARTSENRLYVDGALEAKAVAFYEDSDDYRAFASKESDLNIGWLGLSSVYHYQGLLDEMALYNLALPAWYIEALYLAEERNIPCE